MKKIVLAAALVVGGFSPAFAADVVNMPPAAALYNWSGFYAGVFAGGAWGRNKLHDLDGYNAPGGDFDFNSSAFLGGLTIGNNWQVNHLVYGIEGEIGYLGFDKHSQFPPYRGVRGPDDSVAGVKSDFYASLTGRIGYAFDNWLIYAKGGAAGLNTKVSFTDTDPEGTTLISGTTKSGFKVGFTVGGGVEVGITPNWSIKAEYMFADFGHLNHTATSFDGTEYRFSQDLSEVHTVKIGLNYKF